MYIILISIFQSTGDDKIVTFDQSVTYTYNASNNYTIFVVAMNGVGQKHESIKITVFG